MENIRTIEVGTRIEGHAKTTVVLDSKDQVVEARFHVTELKGFEKFMQGRMLYDAPRITTRACGICPVSHHLASVKACEDLLGVDPPETAKMLRELMHMGQFIHSHSLHFFFLAAPDFIMGPDSDPKQRNVLGLLSKNPELVKDAIKIRKFGQELIASIGGKAIHPETAIPGGMSMPLAKNDQEKFLGQLKDLIPKYEEIFYICKSNLSQYSNFIGEFARIDTNFMGLTKNKALELYDGNIRMVDKAGVEFANLDKSTYFVDIAEHIEPWTWLKFPYYKNRGWPNGIYRVGPLARLNVADKINSPKANAALTDFKVLFGKPANQTLAYHQARLIEVLYAMERAQQLLEDPKILSENIRVKVNNVEGEGVGIVEAPRGTLIHHYKADRNGMLKDINLIVATVNNNKSINMALTEAAKHLIEGGKISDVGLNKLEMVVRAYDPCLTCAAHNLDEFYQSLEFVDTQGNPIHIARV
jgi:coenzyme F420-reducing hydrogenase alpha subunit